MFWQTQKVILQNYDIVYVNDFYLQTSSVHEIMYSWWPGWAEGGNHYYKQVLRKMNCFYHISILLDIILFLFLALNFNSSVYLALEFRSDKYNNILFWYKGVKLCDDIKYSLPASYEEKLDP